MIKIYVYSKNNNRFKYVDNGDPEFVFMDLKEEDDFTLTPPPSIRDTWEWVGSEWVDRSETIQVPSLAERQDTMWRDIKQRRYVAITSGVDVPSINRRFHTDDVSVIQYNNIGNMIALGNFEPIQWKVMDNTWITLTEEVFKELQTAMVQNTNRIYQVAEEHKAKMMESDNPEEYDYSTGWEVSVS